MRPHPAIGLLILGAAGLPAAASAKTVKLPEAKPLVSFEVPDDWTLTAVADGLELSAPDHTSVIEVGVVRRAKADIIAWQKAATQRMKVFGVTFDPKINPQRGADGRQAKADPTDIGHIFDMPKDRPDLAIEELPSWSMAPPLAGSGASGGKPAPGAKAPAAEVKPAETKASETKASETKASDTKSADIKPAGAQAEADKGATKRPHFRSLVLYGGALDGKPVDVQFLDFSTKGSSSFLMQQESSASDERAGAVINSVRFLK